MNKKITTKIIGQMDNTLDHTFESANRVYDEEGIAPTINTCGGGGLEPKIVDDLYKNKEDPQVLTPKRTEYGKKIRKNYESHNIYEKRANMTELEPRQDGISNTLTSVQKDNYVLENNYYPCASRGRNPDNPSDRTTGIETEQRIEVHDDGISNCLTSVQKDSLVMEEKIDDVTTREELIKRYRIRKLTPKECWRLMGFSDDDYNRAEAVNSNTQLYKQAGNSIVKNVLMAIFGQLFEGKEDTYKTYQSRIYN